MAFVMPQTTSARHSPLRLAAVLSGGAATTVMLGVYAKVHPAGGQATFKVLFDSMLAFKSWFTTAAMVFAIAQLLTGLRVRDRLPWPRTAPIWLTDVHRLLGTLTLLVSLPVAYHCLWSLGFTFSGFGGRVFWHSVAGCAFYGMFVSKMLAVRIDRLPRWLVPVLGGMAFSLLVVVWVSSAAYYLTGQIG